MFLARRPNKLIAVSFGIILFGGGLSGCQLRPKPEVVSGTSRALEIPPELQKRANTNPARSAETTRDAVVNTVTQQAARRATPTIDVTNPLGSVPPFALPPNPANASQPTALPPLNAAAPPNPAMGADIPTPEEAEGFRLRGREGDDEEEIDTYALPVVVPQEFGGLGGGDDGRHQDRFGVNPNPNANVQSKTRRNVSGTEGLQAINYALDGFEYVYALRSPLANAQAGVDKALGILIQNAMKKQDGAIDVDSYRAARTSGLAKLEAAFAKMNSDASVINQNLTLSPLHSSALAANVRASAQAERESWQNAIRAQVALFDRHAGGLPRTQLQIPSLTLFFPYLTAKSRHMADAYRLEASTIRRLNTYNIASVPGGALDLLTALSNYNEANAALLDAAQLEQCQDGASYRARDAAGIIPALNQIDRALNFVRGLDRDVLAGFTPIMLDAGINESDFVAMRGPLSKALNTLEVTTLSKLATGYNPIFTLIEANKDPSKCEGADGTAAIIADGLIQIGAISLEDVIDAERKLLFEAARGFYMGLDTHSAPITAMPSTQNSSAPYDDFRTQSAPAPSSFLRGRTP